MRTRAHTSALSGGSQALACGPNLCSIERAGACTESGWSPTPDDHWRGSDGQCRGDPTAGSGGMDRGCGDDLLRECAREGTPTTVEPEKAHQ